MKKMLMVPLLALALSAAAAEKPKQPDTVNPATMCNGTYALCIKALCKDQPDSNGNVPCECVLQTGWNMGPNTCDDRSSNLTSTYSNNFNKGSKTVTCPSSTEWAWCYGAKCEKDANDPTGQRVICKCPVKTSTTKVLVSESDCPDANKICSMLWSGATRAESHFANHHYWNWMVENGHAKETYPPAKECTAPIILKKE